MHRHGPGGLVRLLDRPRLVTRRRVGRGVGRGVGGRVGRHLRRHRRVDVPRRVERPASSLLLLLDGVIVARCHGRVLMMLRMRRPLLLLLLLLLQGRRRGGGPTDLPLRIRPARRQRRDHRQRRRRAGRPRRGGRGRRPLIVALTALIFRMLLRLFRRAAVAGVQAGHGRRRARRCQG